MVVLVFFNNPINTGAKSRFFKRGGGGGVTLCQTEGTRQFLLAEYCKYFALKRLTKEEDRGYGHPRTLSPCYAFASPLGKSKVKSVLKPNGFTISSCIPGNLPVPIYTPGWSGHCRSKLFFTRTQHIDSARFWTQTSGPGVHRTDQQPTATPHRH